MSEVELSEPLAGRAIREFLLQVGEGCPNGFYKAYRRVKKKTSYASARRYFWILKKLGLVEPTRREVGQSAMIPKQLYQIVPGMAEDPRWNAPQIALYPATAFGSKRYARR